MDRRGSHTLQVDGSVIESEKEQAEITYKGGGVTNTRLVFSFKQGRYPS